MGGANSWRVQITGEDYLRQQEKRLLHEERRPIIRQASDLLGPGAGPYAIMLQDWNAPEANFVGVFWSEANNVVNSPDDTLYWMGRTMGTSEGFGIQQVWEHRDDADPDGHIRSFIRRFYAPGGAAQYSSWVEVDVDTGWIAPSVLLGADITDTGTWMRRTGTGTGGSIELIMRLTYTGPDVTVGSTGNVSPSLLLFTLDPGIRPTQNSRLALARWRASIMATLFVQTNGEVRLVGLSNNSGGNITSGDTMSGSIVYVGLDS